MQNEKYNILIKENIRIIKNNYKNNMEGREMHTVCILSGAAARTGDLRKNGIK